MKVAIANIMNDYLKSCHKEYLSVIYMASTRNRNDTGNYKSEQRALESQRLYACYQHQGNGQAFSTYLAGDGLLAGSMGPSVLSRNFADIDSFLKGTGSTNLVSPMAPIQPQLKTVESVSFIDRVPLIMPQPMKHLSDQRPLLS